MGGREDPRQGMFPGDVDGVVTRHLQVPSNTLGYGTAGVSVKSGRVLDFDPSDSEEAAQREAHTLNAGLSQRVKERLRYAVVQIVEVAPNAPVVRD